MQSWCLAFTSGNCTKLSTILFVAVNNFFVTTGKSIMFGIKQKENWNFLKKYGAVT